MTSLLWSTPRSFMIVHLNPPEPLNLRFSGGTAGCSRYIEFFWIDIFSRVFHELCVHMRAPIAAKCLKILMLQLAALKALS
jgi:hypothetical protein